MIFLLKYFHVTCVMLSYLLFFLRGVWLLRAYPIMHRRWVRIAPHTVDTLLLTSAVLLAWQLGISPLTHSWLMAKIVALICYIGLGFVAFRFCNTRIMQLAAWVAAQGVFFYIVSVALSRNVAPWHG